MSNQRSRREYAMEAKEPLIGDTLIVTDEEGDPNELEIQEVGSVNAETGMFPVKAEGDWYNVYWSTEDESWVASDE